MAVCFHHPTLCFYLTHLFYIYFSLVPSFGSMTRFVPFLFCIYQFQILLQFALETTIAILDLVHFLPLSQECYNLQNTLSLPSFVLLCDKLMNLNVSCVLIHCRFSFFLIIYFQNNSMYFNPQNQGYVVNIIIGSLFLLLSSNKGIFLGATLTLPLLYLSYYPVPSVVSS